MRPGTPKQSSMPPMEGHPTLVCPISLFERIEPLIGDIASRMNQASAPHEKAESAREMMATVQRLLDCESFDGGNVNCRLCHEFSTLRQKTATLVIKMAAAAGERGA